MGKEDIDLQKKFEREKGVDLYASNNAEKLVQKVSTGIEDVLSEDKKGVAPFSKESEFEEDFLQCEANPEVLGIVLQTILSDWTKGKRESTAASKYEIFLRKAFERGRLNGGPENDSRWYFLILGLKHGILSQEVFTRFNEELLTTMPYFDFFADVTAWKKAGRIVPAGTEGAHQGKWTHDDYIAWADMLDKGTSRKFSTQDAQKNTKEFFYEVMLQSDTARARVERTASSESHTWDHDDAGLFTAALSTEAITKMFQKTNKDEEKYTPSFWRNIMAGYAPYFKGIEKYITDGDREYGTQNGKWQQMKTRNLEEFADKFKAIKMIESSFKGDLGLKPQSILKEGKSILKRLFGRQ